MSRSTYTTIHTRSQSTYITIHTRSMGTNSTIHTRSMCTNSTIHTRSQSTYVAILTRSRSTYTTIYTRSQGKCITMIHISPYKSQCTYATIQDHGVHMPPYKVTVYICHHTRLWCSSSSSILFLCHPIYIKQYSKISDKTLATQIEL